MWTVVNGISFIFIVLLFKSVIHEDQAEEAAHPDDPDAGPKTGPFLLAWAGFMAFWMGVAYLVSNPVFPRSGVISEVMLDQDGWNWSETPKKVSRRNFEVFEKYLTD